MITSDSLDIELMTEKMLADAFTLRDQPSWEGFFQVMESMVLIGRYLQEREGAVKWAEQQLFP